MSKLIFDPTPKQWQAFIYLTDNKTNEILYGGWARWGKSYLGCAWVIIESLQKPWSVTIIWRNELKRLKQTTLLTFFEVAKDFWFPDWKVFTYNAQDWVINFYNGSKVFLIDLSYNPSDPNFDRLGSYWITRAFIDEAQEINTKAISVLRWRYSLLKWGEWDQAWKAIPKAFYSCNPAKNWIYTDFYKPYKDWTLWEDRVFIPSLVTDNPHISQEYIENLKKSDEVTVQRLLYGNFDYDDDPATLFDYKSIVDMFTNSTVSWKTKFISCDVARYWNDKTTIWTWEWHHAYFIQEIDKWSTTDTASRIIELEKQHVVRRSHVVIDEDWVGWGVVDQLRGCLWFINNSSAIQPYEAKYNPAKTVNYANLKTQCYFKLKELMDKWVIAITCTDEIKEKIIEELSIIRIKNIDKEQKIRLETKEEMKEKLWRSPDFADCFIWSTNILTSKWNKNISEIKVWDFVITPFGKRKVLNKFERVERKKLYILNKILCWTWNHKIYTKKWFKKLYKIALRDYTESYNLINLLKWRFKRLLYIMKRNSGFREQVNIITQTNLNEVKDLKLHYIDTYGRSTTEKYQNDTTFTILTEIVSIIWLKIFVLLNDLFIHRNTWKKDLKTKNINIKTKNNWTKLEKKLLNGTSLKNEGNGIKKIIKNHCDQSKKENTNVFHVEKITYQKELKNDFAQIIADKDTTIKSEHIMKKGFAFFVEKILTFVKMKKPNVVQEVVLPRTGGVKVYDLEVEWDNCYYANWYLVSNCLAMRMYFDVIDIWADVEQEYEKNTVIEVDYWFDRM